LGIFGIDYDRPGPGVSKSAPKKRGVRRFFELLRRELGNLVKLNLLFCLFALPSFLLFTLGLFNVGGRLVFFLSFAAAFPLGGAVTACMFCITKMLRDDPCFLLYDFRRKFRENALQAALPGMLSAAFLYTLLYIWLSLVSGVMALGYGSIFLLAVAMVFIGMIAPYIFLQMAHLALKNAPIIKNSILLAIKYAAKSFCGMALGNAIWIVSLLYFPLSLIWAPFLLLAGFSLSWLLNLLFIWPAVDAVFAIDETIHAMREQKMSGIPVVFSAREPLP